jgi:hypothetical protein
VRKALAILLLFILPLQWAWAAEAIDCRREAASATQQLVLPSSGSGAADGTTGSHDCCAHSEPADIQCSSDCTGCHGPGVTALVDLPVFLGVISGSMGATGYSSRTPKHIPDQPLRPPPSSLT